MTPRDLVGRLPICVVELLRSNPHAFIAGGFVRDAIAGLPCGDIDIYGLTEDEVALWQPFDGMELPRAHGGRQFLVPHMGMGFKSNGWSCDEVLIQTMASGPPDETFASFDMGCCRVALAHVGGAWDVFGPGYSSAKQHRLSVDNPGAGTLSRAIKLLRRGWNCTSSEMALAAKIYQAAVDSEQVPQETS